MSAPPPGAVVLSVTGIRGPADAAAVQAALQRCDPAARFWTDWPQGLVAVESGVPAATLRAAVQGAGYGVLQRSGPGTPRISVGGVLARMLLYAVLGAVLGLALGVGLGLANTMLNPDCTRPGSSGGCAIGVGLFGMMFGALGLPAGAITGLVHGLARRR